MLSLVDARYIFHQQVNSQPLIERQNIDERSLIVQPDETCVLVNKIAQLVVPMIREVEVNLSNFLNFEETISVGYYKKEIS